MTERRAIGHTTTTCGRCGHEGLVPGFDADRRVYELCADCGAEHAVELVA